MNPLIVRLARRSLCLSIVFLPAACLSPTPEYEVPEQVAPFFAMDRAKPPPLEVITVVGSETRIKFNIPFRSLDAGEGLRVVFVRDIQPGKPAEFERMVDSYPVPADDRPISEQGAARQIDYPWVFGGDRPVASTEEPTTTLTVILAHESNFADFRYTLRDPLESAQATWLFAFEPTGAE